MSTIIGLPVRTATSLLLSRWGSLVLGASLVVLTATLKPALISKTLDLLGLGTVPIALWVTLLLTSLRFNPRWTITQWQRWAGVGVFIAATLGALAYLSEIPGGTTPTFLIGSDGNASISGDWGRAIKGASPLLGTIRLTSLLLLAFIVLWPRTSYRITRTSLNIASGFVWKRARVIPGLLKLSREPTPSRPRVISYVSQAPQIKSPPQKTILPDKYLEKKDSLPTEREEIHRVEEINGHNRESMEATTFPWRLPPLDLFKPGPGAAEITEENLETARMIEDSLGTHGVEVKVEQIRPGPTVTLYGLAPGWVRRQGNSRTQLRNGIKAGGDEKTPSAKNGDAKQMRVKVDSILAREKDLALALAAPSLRIQAPVPGESIVGIEVPNRKPLLVTTRSVMETQAFQDIPSKGGLPLALGQGSGGEPVVADLRELPHLLIAGATGSGKSVCINALIVSLVGNTLPNHIRLLLIDPKRVELTPFNGLPHLLAPVVVDTDRVVPALRGVMREMHRRYRVFEELGARNIEAYHQHPKRHEPMPYLVLAIDELADLMMASPYDVEQTLCRLAQLGRATGIHLIAATQRPSVDVVTGLIKANFPSRISFAVVSQVDSRTIMDGSGAEKLLGKGDMLFLSSDSPKPQRVQGAYVSDKEISRFMEYWLDQKGPRLPSIDLDPEPEETERDGYGEVKRDPHRDELTEKAKELAGQTKLSTSLLQRRLRIGYPRAARLMDQLEEEGFIASGNPDR
jgi:S-DNA-T family DNA segregation ATPase FtsK/SpoIIIE